VGPRDMAEHLGKRGKAGKRCWNSDGNIKMMKDVAAHDTNQGVCSRKKKNAMNVFMGQEPLKRCNPLNSNPMTTGPVILEGLSAVRPKKTWFFVVVSAFFDLRKSLQIVLSFLLIVSFD